ncbi:NHLP leader peptide family RiPP precursor [Pseudomonas alloputida]|uniref:NHLP leader peptide family RiPP precursor n=1 Tax=Pseudomonas alloputida TaxID=1940621 RepID=UPI001E30B36E|nr:NHLP leader peptide family RiPP precursor [Pseudomonas alloputida]MCE1058436.1 NHLP leader peptide family RiPP precursor [Pseudomonas alloputida]
MSDHEELYQKVVAKCWLDPIFKQSLMADPVKILRDEGFDIPAGIKVKTIEDDSQSFTLVIPPKPQGLSISQLKGGDLYPMARPRTAMTYWK